MNTTMEKTAPVKPVEKSAETVDKATSALQSKIAKAHPNAVRIDVKLLWEGTWRVNVYHVKEKSIVNSLTLDYSYFVKQTEADYQFDPKLGTKHQVDVDVR